MDRRFGIDSIDRRAAVCSFVLNLNLRDRLATLTEQAASAAA